MRQEESIVAKENEELDIDHRETLEDPNKEKYGEYDLAFNKFDRERNGYLLKPEFDQCIEHFINIYPDKKESLLELQNELLIDDENQITKDEFRKLMFTYLCSQDPFNELIDIFKVFDKQNSKELIDLEILHVFNRLGLTLSRNDVDTLMDEADSDHNRTIGFEEFIKIMIAD